nr:MAG TPA: hypothetical protein [Caudoviricetes sp.]
MWRVFSCRKRQKEGKQNETDNLQYFWRDWFSNRNFIWWMGCGTCNPFDFYGS